MATGISLLDFIMELLGNQTARDQFESNPQQSLDDHGFSHLCAADVHDAMPLVIDAAQSFDRTYDAGGPSHVVTPPPPPPVHGGGGVEHAIEQIRYITQNYSYSVDSHNTVVDNSVNQNVWARDVWQSFDNHSVVTTGDHNVVGNGNEVLNGDLSADHGGAVAVGGSATGSADDYSTDVHAYGSGNVAVASNGSSTGQSDSHNSTDSHNTTDSHNNTAIGSGNDSHDNTAIGSGNDSHDDSHDNTAVDSGNDSHDDSHDNTAIGSGNDSHDDVASNNNTAIGSGNDSHDDIGSDNTTAIGSGNDSHDTSLTELDSHDHTNIASNNDIASDNDVDHTIIHI
ncbi:IniB N-terminal domain-containing protein [Kutzneria kofuensis]|uniref:Uncharacterized protein n=1 Tax=Kutzneria kofuensis TaxID=103725 RepID=A0A7W9NJH9_9PSEU|nr:IniB N-terminal domain-containing protein [Kutzneria kofuensis]MBB5895657.1 hypothetical protein [Kutzneria kofuensis]